MQGGVEEPPVISRLTPDKVLIVLGLRDLMENNKLPPPRSGHEGHKRRQFMWKVFVNGEALCKRQLSSSCACLFLLQRRVPDVISPIVFEAAYSLAEHVTGEEERELPALTPVLRWKKGQKIAQKNQVRTLKPPIGTQGGQVYACRESQP